MIESPASSRGFRPLIAATAAVTAFVFGLAAHGGLAEALNYTAAAGFGILAFVDWRRNRPKPEPTPVPASPITPALPDVIQKYRANRRQR